MRCLPRKSSARGTSVNSAPLRRIERPVPREVVHELLCNGRGSTGASTLQILVGSDLDLVPIEAMVLVEACVFRGDDSVLKIGRDLTERNKFVAFAIRRAASPRLQATLDVHCSGRWIDPPGAEGGARRATRDTPH